MEGIKDVTKAIDTLMQKKKRNRMKLIFINLEKNRIRSDKIQNKKKIVGEKRELKLFL